MLLDVFIAGIGGQGSLLIGQILAEASIGKGYNVTWVPVYGVEKRGGDATVTLMISDKEIGAPIMERLNNMIVLHQRMWEKYKNRIKLNGTIFVNSSIVDIEDSGKFNLINIPATQIAIDIGSDKVANMVMLGAFIKKNPIVDIADVERVIKTMPMGSKEKLLALNIEALKEGYQYVK